ncbi:Hypothetical protein KVN_LOCUS402 [uncultured virus]|nr:Hypothetical protein KVN_LOCUS402 [uncultured virus]
MDSNNFNLNNIQFNEITKFLGPVQLKTQIHKGGIATYMVAVCMPFNKIDPESTYGKEFFLIPNVILPLFRKLCNLFQFSVVNFASSSFGRELHSAFWFHFDHKMVPFNMKRSAFIQNGSDDHFRADISVLLRALLSRLRLYSSLLSTRGWKGKYWADQEEFSEMLRKIVDSLPEQVDEEYFVKKRSEKDTDNQEEEQYEEENQENEDSKNQQSSGKLDSSEYIKKIKKIEPMVREVEEILFKAQEARRLSSDGKTNNKMFINTKKMTVSKQMTNQKPDSRRKPNNNGQNDDSDWKEIGKKGKSKNN